jgi:hypothetical protein
MTSPNIKLSAQESLVEEHLTDAIAFVLSHYRYPKSANNGSLDKSRLAALLNVLASELNQSTDQSRLEQTIDTVARDIVLRVRQCQTDVFYDHNSAGSARDYLDSWTTDDLVPRTNRLDLKP